MVLLAAAFLAQAPIAELPFETVGNRIYLKGALLNGQPVNAVLDTGAGSSVADDVLGDKVGAKKNQEIVASGAGAKPISAWIVGNLNVTLTGTGIKQPIPVILPLAPLTAMEGRPLETILGFDFLNRYRVEIDYAASRVRLFDRTDDSIPAGASVLAVDFTQNTPHVKGKIDLPGIGSKDVTMMFDTGATSAATLTNRFVSAQNLNEKYKSSPEITLGGGVGGETRGRRIRLASETLGDSTLLRPVAVLDATTGGATGKGATYDVLVGGESLRRFTVTLDYAHKRIFLKPNANFADPFIGDKIGATLIAAEGGGFEVKQVIPASPAAEAGIVAGDTVLSIAGSVPPSLEDARRLFRNVTGDLQIKIRHVASERTLTLKTRELIP